MKGGLNMAQIIALLKTLLMRDSDPTDINKPLWQRRSVTLKIVAIIGYVLYYKWGLVLDNDVKDMLVDNYQVVINSVQALVVAILAIYGTVGSIVGKRGHIKKLNSMIANSVPCPPVEITPIATVEQPIVSPKDASG
jgi:hypothetical protein